MPRRETSWISLREGLERHVRAVLACADPQDPYLVIVLSNGQEIEIDLDLRLDEWSNGASAPND